MNRLLLIVVFLFSHQVICAQSERTDLLNFSFDFANHFTNNGNMKTRIRPVFLSYESYIKEKISAGVQLGYTKSSFQTLGFQKLKLNFVSVEGFANYHIFQNTKWDAYAGGGLGIIFSGVNAANRAEKDRFKNEYTDAYKNNGTLLAEVHIGGRYFFSEQLAARLELGVGRSEINVGVSYILSKRISEIPN